MFLRSFMDIKISREAALEKAELDRRNERTKPYPVISLGAQCRPCANVVRYS
jgi:hypothetical protein